MSLWFRSGLSLLPLWVWGLPTAMVGCCLLLSVVVEESGEGDRAVAARLYGVGTSRRLVSSDLP